MSDRRLDAPAVRDWAHAAVGDLIIIAAFGQLPANEVASFQPKLVFVDESNRIKEERSTIAVQGL